MLHRHRLVDVARAAVMFLSLSALGCADWTLVEVGADQVEPFELERSYTLSSAPLAECPSGRRALDAGSDAREAVVVFTPVAAGCVVDIDLTGALLVSADRISGYAEQIEQKTNLGALRGMDLELRELDLSDGEGVALDLGVHSISVAVEGELVLSEEDVAAMREGLSPRVTLPQVLMDAFVEAMREREELRTDLRIRILVRNPDRNVPNELGLRAMLQPIVFVDALASL